MTLWTGTIFVSFRENGNVPEEIALLMQQVKY